MHKNKRHYPIKRADQISTRNGENAINEGCRGALKETSTVETMGGVVASKRKAIDLR